MQFEIIIVLNNMNIINKFITDFMNTKYMFIIKWDYVTHSDHVIINNDDVQHVRTHTCV